MMQGTIVKRESKSQWIKRKHTNMFRGSSTQLYVPAFTQKDFQSTCPHRTPTQGTSTEDLGQYNNWEYTTPLFTNTTSTLRGQAQSHHKSITSQLEGWAQSQQPINLSLEGQGTKPPLQNQPLHKRDNTKQDDLQLSDQKTTNQIFSTKTRILQRGQNDKLKCGKQSVFNKENHLGNSPKRYKIFRSKTIPKRLFSLK